MGILNLWKLDGLPTSYNPLPSGWGNEFTSNKLGGKTVILKMRAKSPSNGRIRVDDKGSTTITSYFNLSSVFKDYELEIKIESNARIIIVDDLSAGDIVIEDIELIEKPLGKLTINGVPGFKSGKWSIHPNAVIESDRKLLLNADGTVQFSYVYFECEPNTEYIFSIKTSANTTRSYAQSAKRNGDLISTDAQINGSGSKSFISSNDATHIRIRIDNGSELGTFSFEDANLVKGRQNAPYTENQGDRMVKNHIISKNLFCDKLSKFYDEDSGRIVADPGANSYYRQDEYELFLTPGETYTLQAVQYIISSSIPRFMSIHYRDRDGNQITESSTTSYTTDVANITETFTVPEGTHHVLLRYGRGISQEIYHVEYDNIMINKGTSALPYEEFEIDTAPLSKRQNIPDKGLVLDGVTSYINFGPNYKFTTEDFKFSFDIRFSEERANFRRIISNGVYQSNGYEIGVNGKSIMFRSYNAGTMTLTSSNPVLVVGNLHTVEIIKTNLTVEIYIDGKLEGTLLLNEHPDLTTNSTTMIVGGYSPSPDTTDYMVKATLYNLFIYENDNLLSEFDFTKPIGRVLNPSKNLLPSFESGEWSLHAAVKVYGPSVLFLDAGDNWRTSSIIIDAEQNTEYNFSVGGNGKFSIHEILDDDTQSWLSDYSMPSNYVFKTSANAVSFKISLTNATFGVGKYTFMNPVLIKVKDNGVLHGGAKPKLKTPKRLLHRKR